MSERQSRWDRRHAEAEGIGEPALILGRYGHLLPREGDALDLACGRGASALFLARRGLATSAWDLSPVAIERLRGAAASAGLAIDAQVRDLVARPPRPGSFDVILVSHFLERGLAGPLMAALRPGGLLFYQTFTRERVGDAGPANPDYRLAPNELLRLFAPLRLRAYQEEGRLGDLGQGVRDLALYVGERI